MTTNQDDNACLATPFELIIKHKDTNSSNLSHLFESYGCNTLEAKVPVVRDPIVEKLKDFTPVERKYATLALAAESASMAMEGRRPKTKNANLNVVNIDGKTVLSVGRIRDKLPVSESELDDEIDKYMRERAMLKTKGEPEADSVEYKSENLWETRPTLSKVKTEAMIRVKRENMSQREIEPDQDELDAELEAYMKEANRLRDQKRSLAEQTDRMDAMETMERYENMMRVDSDDDF